MKSQILWLKTKLIDFRELIWPLLEPEDAPDVNAGQENADEIKILVASENIEKAFELKLKIHDAEEERRKGIESKAAIFISTISISTSVFVASNALISGNADNTVAIKISVLISFALCVYTLRTVWFCVRALEKGSYHLLSFKDINIKGDKDVYYKHLIKVLVKKTVANYSTINAKVDNITMAQAYYKIAIFIICLYAFFIFVFCFFLKKTKTDTLPFKPSYAYFKAH